jgi:hypothetical protein
LESEGIPTVIIGSARDIVEQCGVPRFVFQDLPLGNPCGVPYDRDMQYATVSLALDLLQAAIAPRTTVQTPFTWPTSQAWRTNFMRVDESTIEELRRAGVERREQQAARKAEGRARTI